MDADTGDGDREVSTANQWAGLWGKAHLDRALEGEAAALATALPTITVLGGYGK